MFKSGQIINDTYEIKEKIGSGGGGIIYKAVHIRMRKDVAIKLIKENVIGLIRNRSEVDLLKDLKHPFLPQVIDFFECDNEVYTVMEFIEGQDFKQIISSGKTFSESEVREFGKQLCSAVSYLHGHNPPIIHSDIKPANIMLTPEGNICLIDFNISTVVSGGEAFSVGGSKGFAAPEQFKKVIDVPINEDEFHEETRFLDNLDDDRTEFVGESNESIIKTKNISMAYVDTRTDIYGIGASLYYILTGRVPIGGETDFRGIKVSSKMKNLINKALSAKPEKRFSSADELKAALDSSIGGYVAIGVSAVLVIAGVIAVVAAAGGQSGKNNEVTAAVIETEPTTVSAAVAETEPALTETAEEQTTVPATESETETTTITEETSNELIMPDITGVIVHRAAQICSQRSIKFRIEYVENDTLADGMVFQQSVAAGTQLAPDDVVVLYIGKTPDKTTVSENNEAVTTPSVTTAAPSITTTAPQTTEYDLDTIAFTGTCHVYVKDGKYVVTADKKYSSDGGVNLNVWIFDDNDNLLQLGEVWNFFGAGKNDDLKVSYKEKNKTSVEVEFNNKWLAFDGNIVPAFTVLPEMEEDSTVQIVYMVPCYINENYDEDCWVSVGYDYLLDDFDKLRILGVSLQDGTLIDYNDIETMEFRMDGITPEGDQDEFCYTYYDFTFDYNTEVSIKTMHDMTVVYSIVFKDEEGNRSASDSLIRYIP